MERIILCAVIFYETGIEPSTVIFRIGEGLLELIPVSVITSLCRKTCCLDSLCTFMFPKAAPRKALLHRLLLGHEEMNLLDIN